MQQAAKLLLSAIFVLIAGVINAQCGITVNAGEDIILCEPGGSATLNGTIDGAFGFAWEENETLGNPRILTPTVSPTESTDYVLIGYTVDPADNLIVNGDFEQGNTGFFSEYEFEPGGDFGPISSDGTYSITPNSRDAHSAFNRCSDNSGSGNMMACNGSTQANLKVWCQTVDVMPNTTYVLRAFIASIWRFGAAEIQFSVNNDLVGPIFMPTLTPPCTYDFFDERWTSDGTETTAEICIVNQTTEFFGFNFALDDIFFAPTCEQYDTVRVERVNTNIIVEDTYELPCGTDAAGFPILASGLTDPGYQYEWTTNNGNIVSGADSPTVFVDAVGTYRVTLSFTSGTTTCSETQFVTVTQGTTAPEIVLESNGDLNCNNEETFITAENSFFSLGSEFSWSTPNGNIISATDDEFIRLDAAGTYFLTINSGGCSTTDAYTITADFSEPFADIAPAPELSCDNPTINLDASTTVLGPDDVFFWTTDDGEITDNANTLTPTVSQAGTYELTVENSVTGCFDQVTVTVTGSGEPPEAIVDTPPSVNCQGDPVELSGAPSSDSGNATYAWSSTNGQFAGPTDGISVQITSAGTYALIITEPNGCSDTTEVVVEQEGFNPPIAFSPIPPITCARAQTNIVANVTVPDGVTYAWSTTDGQIISGGDSLAPVVGSAGTYRLLITEPGTDCSVNAVVEVLDELDAPAVSTPENATITCRNSSVPLTIVGDVTDLEVGWTDVNDITVTDQVSEAGNYFLMARNPDNGCTTIDTLMVAVDTVAPSATPIAGSELLTCVRDSVEIAVAGPTGDVDYRWMGPEGERTGRNITVGSPGNYVLTATANGNGCSATDDLTVRVDRELPVIAIAPPTVLTCERTSLQLDGSVENPDGFDLRWATDGSIVADENTLNPTVAAPGNYELILLNPATGCTDSVSVTVRENVTQPVARIAPADTLTCREGLSLLDGAASTGGDTIGYRWATMNGGFDGATDGITATATAAGAYQLLVSNRNTGCRDSATVTVVENADRPAVELGETLTLTCDRTTVTLNEGEAAASGLNYSWSQASVSGTVAATPSLVVSTGDRYELMVENPENGCIATDFVMVEIDTLHPVAAIAEPAILNCTTTALTLDGSASVGQNPDYEWTTSGGSFALTTVGNQSRIDAPGTYVLTVQNDNGCTDAASVTVGIDTLRPTIELPAIADLNCRNTSREIAANITNNQGATLRYEWSGTDENTATISVTEAATYSLTVTNEANNCRQTAAVTVAVDTVAPVLNPLPDNLTLTCNQPSVTLNESVVSEPGFAYSWSGSTAPVANEPALTVTTADRFRYVVENLANGCVSEASVAVAMDTLHPVALVAPAVDLNCTVAEVTLDGAASSGRNPEFAWTSDDGNFIDAGDANQSRINAPGTYVLTLRNDNGCTDAASVTVGIDTLRPIVNLPAVTDLNCRTFEREIVASISNDGGALLNYAWSSSVGNLPEPTGVLRVTNAGTYTLEVTNETNTCTAATSVSVAVDTLRPTVPDLPTSLTLDCDLSEVILNEGATRETGFFYRWTVPNLPENLVTQPQLRVNAANQYQLEIEDLTNGCRAAKSVRVFLDTVAPLVTLPASLDLGCDTLPVTLLAAADAADYTFAWSTTEGQILGASSIAEVEVQGPGVYALAVSNPRNGCTTDREISLTQTLLEGFAFELAAPNCLQPLGELTFGALAGGVGPFVYSIDGGQTYNNGSVYRSLNPDRYDLRVQDVRGCETAAQLTVPEARELAVELPPPFSIRLGDSVNLPLTTNFALADIDTLVWSGGPGLSCYDCPNPVAKPLESTTYTIEVTSQEGCQARAQVQITVDEQALIYVPTAFSPNGDGVNDVFAPLAAAHRVRRVLTFEVADRWGNQLHRATDLPLDGSFGGWDGRLRGERVNVGVCVWWAEVELLDGRRVLVKGDLVVM